MDGWPQKWEEEMDGVRYVKYFFLYASRKVQIISDEIWIILAVAVE